jgi:hypothetical protein
MFASKKGFNKQFVSEMSIPIYLEMLSKVKDISESRAKSNIIYLVLTVSW